MKKKNMFIAFAILLVLILAAGCSRSGTPGDAKEEGPVQLRVAVLPDVDSLPILLADRLGYFTDEGVDVRVEMFKSPVDRDSALQSGQLDGAISDVLAAAFFIDKGFDVKITSSSDGRYCILASKDSGIERVEDLRGVEIAMSSNTIIEYEVDKLLTSMGLKSNEIAKIAIPKMPVRMQMLEEGKVKAAGLPEPLATLQLTKGAKLIASSDDIGEAPGIIMFTGGAIDKKAGAIEGFYRAYNRAAEELNRNGEKYRELLVDAADFPEPVKDVIEFPKYRRAVLPSEGLVEEVISWLKDKGLISKKLEYNQMVEGSFLE
jgi:NitT/TauT family transport system substrate-binding protein